MINTIEQRAEAWYKENPDVTDVKEAYYIGFDNAQTEYEHQTASLEERVKELEEVLAKSYSKADVIRIANKYEIAYEWDHHTDIHAYLNPKQQ